MFSGLKWMSTLSEDIFSPPVCRDMKTLDRRKFHKHVQLVAAVVEPRQIPHFRKHCDADILKQARLRSIYDRDGLKLIALRPEIQYDPSQLHPESKQYIAGEGIEIVPFDLELSYDYWHADDIFSAVLPIDLVEDSPTGFTMVGHIAHMNLRDEYLPYKQMIGQVILDKNAAVKTVVNKLNTIDSVYRNFQMEVLAGKEDFVTEHYESGCRFRFDFSKVYWNSRLHHEHDRLVHLFQRGEAVCDVMAGVGPFAIPAAKRGVIVFANDLNPASHAALVENIHLNGVSDFVTASNADGRQCISNSLTLLQKLRQEKEGAIIVNKAKPPARKKSKSEALNTHNSTSIAAMEEIAIPETFQHYVMNLPATAIEFLDAFRGLYRGRDETLPRPTIHVHCFTKCEDEADAHANMTARIGDALGHTDLSQHEIQFHHVRRVAPSKDMYCCSFVLPKKVAYAE